MTTTRLFAGTALALLVGACAPAATTSTTLTVNANVAFGTSISATGPATLSGIGSGTFAGTLSLTDLSTAIASGKAVSAPFTITLSGGTLTGSLSIPASLLTGTATSGSGSATITGGTGTYAGATGSFATLAGTATGSLLAGFALQFTGPGSITTSGTGGGGPTTPTVTVTEVLDAGGYTANIAQGSIFVVKGSNLAPGEVKFASYPLPTVLNTAKITFTPAAGGSPTDAFMVYTCCSATQTQLAAILPSTLAAGNYNVTVTNGSATSAPFAATVVQRKPGLLTQDTTGSGLATVQNYVSATRLDVNRLTTGTVSGVTISPAKPGQVLIAFGTGLGPVTGGDNVASPGFDFAANGVTVRVIVGGMSITPAYAGRAPGFSGEDQINFTLPANVPTGCSVPFQVSVNGALSNPTTLAIAPDAASTACVQPGYTTQQLQDFDQGKAYTAGAFYLSQIAETLPQTGAVKFNSAAGGFARITGLQLGSSSSVQANVSTSGDCLVTHVVSAGNQGTSGVTVANLDAGAVTLNGPPGSNITNLVLRQDPKYLAYSATLASEGLSLPGGSNGTIIAGKYTLAGAGGKDVGAFNASLTLGTPITVTGGLPSTVIRSAGLTLNWTGGLATDIVSIGGSASTVTGTGTNAVTDSTSFSCTTTAGKGTFTVPASVLQQLPAVPATSTTGGGFLQLFSGPNPTSGNGQFTAPLTAGGSIDSGSFFGLVGVGGTAAYQ
jgi:uncharacterized protein (TIGR03437 family)